MFSSLAGIAWRKYSEQRAPAQASGSHGASGAIYSVVSFFACVAPTATFYLFGIIPLPAWGLVTGIFLFDGYSAVNHQVCTMLIEFLLETDADKDATLFLYSELVRILQDILADCSLASVTL